MQKDHVLEEAHTGKRDAKKRSKAGGFVLGTKKRDEKSIKEKAGGNK